MSAKSETEPLRSGRTRCPVDRSPLHWEQIGGWRVINGGHLTARCPKCDREYKVRP